jgi:A/G-specific adenine glycosylase
VSESAALRRALRRWYAVHGRHNLPWRQTRDPYAVLVSEVMLQQTQVERVLPYYETWRRRWPDFAALADAPLSEVIRAWRGLGYNRRAVALHRLAQLVAASGLPEGESALRALPGIGPYTASAIACFAREETVPVFDTNIARVVARTVLGVATQREATARQLAAGSRSLLPARGGRDHNLALMDLGAMVCLARAPRCEVCPVARHCAWNLAGRPVAPTTQKSSPAFESTARFARGRIVDLLRESPRPESEIAAALPGPHRTKVDEYLHALTRDGLARQMADGAWTLP